MSDSDIPAKKPDVTKAGRIFAAVFIGLLIVGVGACSFWIVSALSSPTPDTTPACPNPVEQRYFNALTSEMRSWGAVGITIGEDFTNAGDDPMLLIDDTWIMRMATNIHLVEQRADAIIALEWPVSVASVRQLAVRMANDLKAAMALMTSGIDNLELDDLEEATELMVRVGDTTDYIHADIASFCG